MNHHRTNMKVFLTAFLVLPFATTILSQKPKDGTYTYSIAFAEWQGKSLGATCTVIIKGDSIRVVHDGKGNLTGKKAISLKKV